MHFKNILVALDINDQAIANQLMDYTTTLASKADKLNLISVVDVNFESPFLDRMTEVKESYYEAAGRQLEKLASDRNLKVENAVIKSGRTYSLIVETAKELGADLIIVGAHKQSMGEYLLGMTAARVVRHAACSVTVIRTS